MEASVLWEGEGGCNEVGMGCVGLGVRERGCKGVSSGELEEGEV